MSDSTSDPAAPPRAGAAYYKAHGLGNDYLVFEEGSDWALTPSAVRAVCDRWRGVGGDGVVFLLGERAGMAYALRMFNPDGSEFERSGNGLRILASHLARTGRVDERPFQVRVGGDVVRLTVHGRSGPAYDVSADMGRALVGPGAVALAPGALDGQGRLAGPDGEPLDVTPVSVGNPHLVVHTSAATEQLLLRVGPFLATHPQLGRGANVQVAQLEGPRACRALIWERGVGRTTASGTSSCAVAVAMVWRRLIAPGPVLIRMEGGELAVDVSAALDVVLRGPVEEVCEGRLTPAFVASLADP